MRALAHRGLLIVTLLIPAGCATRNPIHTGQLLGEMTDMQRLTELPDPAYRTVQFSSFDRASNQPGGPGWFGNSDGFGGEDTPGFEAVVEPPNADGVGQYLICDVQGPGAIVRTWTAAIEGSIQLFLDDMHKPVYDGPAADFLFCPYKAMAAEGTLDTSDFANTFQQHEAAYCPIPFGKRCRMVWIGDVKKVHFYHVQIREYEPGTFVRTFTPADLQEYEPELRQAARVLGDPDAAFAENAAETPVDISVTLPPGESREVVKIDGPAELSRLTLRVEAADIDLALRQTLLHVLCDGADWGQVQSPIGDFFGAAPGINPYRSLPFTVSPDGTMTCRYVMPFASSLRIVLENRGGQEVTVAGTACSQPYEWNERSLHFRARWRVDHGVLGTHRPPKDMPYVVAQGAGRYVGTALMLLNPARVPTPYGGWWGEGDEKIFVDDDVVPSTFGTGSEDYFNYAWSVPDIFICAYCGQPRDDGPGNRGFVTNDRWHIIDDLPFHNRFAFYMELYPHDVVPGISYARIGYYYARPGTIDDHLPITDEDLRPLDLPANWEPAAGFAMHNAVYVQAEELLPANAPVEKETNNLWAGSELCVWRPTAAGQKLEMNLPIAETGKYRLHLAARLDNTGGRVRVELDGKSLGDVIDLYVPYRVLARQFRLQSRDLAAGSHTLTLIYEGADDGVAAPAIGIDYFAVQKQ
ncbi:MAG: DUF2961 domain-containing protein [Phycisphaerae bacterium]|jgi:hypothetical protein